MGRTKRGEKRLGEDISDQESSRKKNSRRSSKGQGGLVSDVSAYPSTDGNEPSPSSVKALPVFKLKLKMGTQVMGTKSISSAEITSGSQQAAMEQLAEDNMEAAESSDLDIIDTTTESYPGDDESGAMNPLLGPVGVGEHSAEPSEVSAEDYGEYYEDEEEYIDEYEEEVYAEGIVGYEDEDSLVVGGIYEDDNEEDLTAGVGLDVTVGSEDDEDANDDDEDDDGDIEVGDNDDEDDLTSDEEKEWLDALESGDLDEYEKKKQEKDPSLLTARQKAKITDTGNYFMSLPSGYRDSDMTEEQVQRKRQRAIRRKMQAEEKGEKAKKLTLERLLNKQEAAKQGRGRGRRSNKKPPPPVVIRYLSDRWGTCTSYPPGCEEAPVACTRDPIIPKPQLCIVKGCGNLKKYSCSKTKVPLCSLSCYKANLAVL